MSEHFSPLLESKFHEGSTERNVLIDAIITDDSEYTGRYRATIDGIITTELTWRSDDCWEETGKGETELAKLVGALIAKHEE